jgi:hypothetical protein
MGNVQTGTRDARADVLLNTSQKINYKLIYFVNQRCHENILYCNPIFSYSTVVTNRRRQGAASFGGAGVGAVRKCCLGSDSGMETYLKKDTQRSSFLLITHTIHI